MSRLLSLSAAFMLLSVAASSASSVASAQNGGGGGDLQAHREALLKRSASSSISGADLSGGLPHGDTDEHGNRRKGPFHPKRSQKLDERRAARELEKGGRGDPKRKRGNDHHRHHRRGGSGDSDDDNAFSHSVEDRRRMMEEHKKRMRERMGKAAVTDDMPPVVTPATDVNAGADLARHELITDPARKELLTSKYLAQQRGSAYDGRTADLDSHIFADLINEPEPSADASEAEREAYNQRRNYKRNHYFNSHPANVQPTAPNFGLRYRTTHLATLSFAAENLEGEQQGGGAQPAPAKIDLGNVTVALFGKSVPKTVDNFVGLCNAVKGFGYVNSTIHRVISDFIIQGGDIEFSEDGEGGYTVHAEEEDDIAEMDAIRAAAEGNSKSESRSVSLDNPSDVLNNKNIKGDDAAESSSSKSSSQSLSASTSKSRRRTAKRYIDHENYLIPHGAGTISMAAAHRNKVGSQFYFMLDGAHATHLNRRFVAFGHVVFGFRTTLDTIAKLRVDGDDRPIRAVTITGCEAVPYRAEDEEPLVKQGKRMKRSRMLRDDHFTDEQMAGYHAEVEKLIKADAAKSASRSLGRKSLSSASSAVAADGTNATTTTTEGEEAEVDSAAVNDFFAQQALLAKGPVTKDVTHELRRRSRNKRRAIAEGDLPLRGGRGGMKRAERAEQFRARREEMRKLQEKRKAERGHSRGQRVVPPKAMGEEPSN